MRKPSPQVPGERAGPAAGLGAADREIPGITAPMHRYLEQVACVLRPRSVVNTDQALRSFARFLTEATPQVTCWYSRHGSSKTLEAELMPYHAGVSIGSVLRGVRCTDTPRTRMTI